MTIILTGIDALCVQLALDDDGDLPEQPYLKRGADAIMQKIGCRFKFFFGEWFLDTRLGVPWFQYILVKNPDRILVNAIFRKILVTTPGIKTVLRFDSTLDKATRTLTASFECQLDNGSTLTVEKEPFILVGK